MDGRNGPAAWSFDQRSWAFRARFESVHDAQDWECEKCGCNNFARRNECFKCGAAKPASTS